MKYVLLGVLSVAACAESDATADDDDPDTSSTALPLIAPPVRAATPAGLAASASARLGAAEESISAVEFRSRFFGPGPTNVFNLLDGIDERLAEINQGIEDASHACLDDAPTEYEIAPLGQAVALKANCYREFSVPSGTPAFMQFGQSDGLTSLFITGGAARLAARITPIAGTTEHEVEAWYGVGYTNATSEGCDPVGSFDGCSYAVTQLRANPTTGAFEMSVAGIGVGFCGVQIRSDGVSIYGVGSADMGTTCREVGTLCVSADDLTAAGDCADLETFSLPALGRGASSGGVESGASTYPDEPNVTLDGTDTDSLHFGPGDAPTAGVGSF